MIRKIILLLTLVSTQLYAADNALYIEESRQAALKLGKELKKTLQASLKKDRPVAALEVCNIRAPEIADSVSGDRIKVARTSLKTRNSSNKADSWEKNVLSEFERLKKSGEQISALEYSEIIRHDGKKTFRYMKAIPTGDVCLMCHGSQIAEPLASKIKQLYPDDQATGFSKGDIRGAFTVTREL